MKKFYIKILVLIMFSTLYFTQDVLSSETSIQGVAPSSTEGVGIRDLKKIKEVKSLFHKKTKQQAPVQKSLKMEETELDTSAFSAFEDEKNEEIIPSDKKINSSNIQNNKEKKKLFGFLKKKKEVKQNKDNTNETIQEEIKNEEIITPDEEIKTEAEPENKTNIVYIKEVEVFGNNLLDVAYIKEQIKSKEGFPYNRQNVSNDLRSLYNTGYFTQNLRALPIKIDDSNIKLRIILEENPPISGFSIVGNKSIPTSEIMNILNRYRGKPQNILEINNAISEIQELYSMRGYILARVTKVQDDPDGNVNILINEGIIGDIIVEGNDKTKDFIVKRNIFLQPGCVYNENTMRSDILRLMGTQAFKDVQRELQQDENTGLYNVFIALEEQRTGKISLGVGIDSASGFFGSVGFGENNFRGLGQKLNLNVLAGTGILMNDSSVIKKANLQGELSFFEPMFKKENQSLMIRGFGRYYGSYQVPLAIEKRFGGEITLSRKFIAFKNLSGSLGFGFESVNMSEGDAKASKKQYEKAHISWAKRKEELSDGMYIKVSPSITYDTRDNMVNARHGTLAKFTLEENFAISGSTFGKIHGMIRRFIPVGKKSSFVVTARAGGKINGSTPEFANFALGGPYTIRGFNISEVGVGEGYMMGSAEYRLPIPFIDRLTSNTFLNNLRLAAFVDAGTLFDKSIGTRVYNRPGYAISAGVGLRVFIPGLGPINLDYGIPITNTMGADRKRGFFTFGMGEMY